MVATSCPSLRPIQGRGLQYGPEAPVPDSVALPVLQCLAQIHAVTLDGASRPELQFRFCEHPTTGIRGSSRTSPPTVSPMANTPSRCVRVRHRPGVGDSVLALGSVVRQSVNTD
ncbi:MAG TPA: hypothetical protein VJO33_17215 [Gemmatimonadaceae bacterium]|nr:hypothetical protein [Gemmatimonadaceae bacterium]